MKQKNKLIVLLICLSVLLSGISPVFAEFEQAYTLGDNVMIDGGFEEGLWDFDKTSVFSEDLATIKTGEKSLKVTAEKTNEKLVSPEIELKENKKYRLGVWVKSMDLTPKGAVTIGLEQFTGAGYEKIASETFGGTVDWEYAGIYTSSSVSGRVRVFIETKPESQGTLWVDDISLSALTQVVFEAEGENNTQEKTMFSDIAGSEYKQEIEIVASLGLMDSNTDMFLPGEGITRGEFAHIVTKLLGINYDLSYDKVIYTDVDAANKFYGAVSYVTDMGLMSGFSDNTFRPSEQITFSQAIKVFVSMLNLDEYAKARGGYPNGYIDIAGSAELLRGIKTQNDLVTKELMAALICNLLEAESYDKGVNGISLEKSIAFSEKYLDITTGEGIITANGYTGLSSSVGCSEGLVLIGDAEFYGNLSSASEYLGQNVKYYAKETDDESVLLYVYPEDNEILEIDARDIDDAKLTEDRQFAIYRYDENDKVKEEKIDINTDVIYNGIFNNVPQAKDFMPEVGSVTLIDNNHDGEYDVVFVKSQIIYRVSDVSANRGFITDANDKPQLKFERTDKYEPQIIKDGEVVTLEHIKKDDILYVERSKKSSGDVLTTIYVYNNQKSGTVMETNDEYAVIGSYRYPVSDILFKNAEFDENGDIRYTDTVEKTLNTGENGVVWVDSEGYIIDFEAKELTGLKYGYLVDGKYVDGDSEPFMRLRIFTEEGTFKNYELKKKVVLDGTRLTDEAAGQPATKIHLVVGGSIENPLYEGSDVKEQLIAYYTDAEGKITQIDTEKRGVSETEESLTMNSDFREMSYFSSSKTVSAGDTVYLPQSNVKIFVMPQDKYSSENETEYSVGGISMFYNEMKSTLKIYNADELNRCEVIIMRGASAERQKVDASLMFVTGISTGITNDGELCTVFEGFANGEQTSVKVIEDSVTMSDDTMKVSDIKPGYVIRYTKNGRGEMGFLDVPRTSSGKVYDLTKDGFGRNYTLYYSNNLLVYGEIVAKDGAYLMVDVSEAGDGSLPILFVCDDANANIYEYSRSEPKDVSVVSINNASVGDKVFMRLYNTRLQDAVIVRD